MAKSLNSTSRVKSVPELSQGAKLCYYIITKMIYDVYSGIYSRREQLNHCTITLLCKEQINDKINYRNVIKSTG